MNPVLIVLALVAVGLLAAFVINSRQDKPEPTQGANWSVPIQLDRSDFDRPDASWLLAVFSSETCLACQATGQKAEALASDAVVVQDIGFGARRDLHEKYSIDAVPMLLIADSEGEVRRSFVGEPSTSDLWAVMAELRDAEEV